MASRPNDSSAIDLRARCFGPSYISKFVPPNMSTMTNGWAFSRLMFSRS